MRLIGDVPIYVAPGSADHVAHPELFRDDVVAGAPPDYFTAKGQLWGNPIYDWPALRRRGYRFWIERFRRTFDLFDLARVDHFRGFAAYWAIPRGAPDARPGKWVRGPGRAPFDAARAALGSDLPIIAEDLGVITPAVVRLRDDLGFPGMVVLQFAFNPDDPNSPHDLFRHREHQVLYTGTHDNDTLRGWYEGLPEKRLAVLRAAGVRGAAALVGPHRARPGLGGAAVHAAGAGRAGPRQRGADEPAGDGERELGVPAGAGAADEAPREAVAGGSRRARGGCVTRRAASSPSATRSPTATASRRSASTRSRGRSGSPRSSSSRSRSSPSTARRRPTCSASRCRGCGGRTTSPASTLGVNDVRGLDFDAAAYERDLRAIAAAARAASGRLVLCTLPEDLGRPRAAPKPAQASAIVRRLATETGAGVVALDDLAGAPWLLPDAVHPTAVGQLEIADRAARVLGAPRLPSATVEVHRSRRARGRFAARHGVLLAGDLRRRAVERITLRA